MIALLVTLVEELLLWLSTEVTWSQAGHSP
jgi:hypothetical protein